MTSLWFKTRNGNRCPTRKITKLPWGQPTSVKLLFTRVCAKSLQLCPTLCNSMNCSLSASSIHGILQARILEGAAIHSSGGSSWPRVQTCISKLRLLCLLHRQMGSSLLEPLGRSQSPYLGTNGVSCLWEEVEATSLLPNSLTITAQLRMDSASPQMFISKQHKNGPTTRSMESKLIGVPAASQVGTQKHLAISGDTFVFHNWDVQLASSRWRSVRLLRVLQSILSVPRDSKRV